ncbi:MAG TPA: hypothetical protein VJL29_03330 [Thermoguttaceae bacterium]|nr:hypothetical protein [Thermoguttaceae bacterium]
MCVFSLIGYALRRDAAVALGCLDMVIDCAMMWFLLGGVMELATTRNRPDLAQRASHRRIAYVALMGLVLVVSVMAYNARGGAGILGVALVICMLVLLVLILHLIHRAKHELTGGQTA